MILFGNFSASQVLFVSRLHYTHAERWSGNLCFYYFLLAAACCQLAWAVNLFSIYLYSLFFSFLFFFSSLLLLSLLLPVSLFHSHTPLSIPFFSGGTWECANKWHNPSRITTKWEISVAKDENFKKIFIFRAYNPKKSNPHHPDIERKFLWAIIMKINSHFCGEFSWTLGTFNILTPSPPPVVIFSAFVIAGSKKKNAQQYNEEKLMSLNYVFYSLWKNFPFDLISGENAWGEKKDGKYRKKIL